MLSSGSVHTLCLGGPSQSVDELRIGGTCAALSVDPEGSGSGPVSKIQSDGAFLMDESALERYFDDSIANVSRCGLI